MTLEQCLVKLGWCKYDGNLWIKNGVILHKEDIVLLILRKLTEFKEKL